MDAYLYLSAPFALMAMAAVRKGRDGFLWFFAFVLVVLFVGLRHKVGMDWNNYLRMSRNIEGSELVDAIVSEPGYAALLWLSTWSGNSVYLANFVGTVILAAGTFRFARRTPEPWMAIMAATPILFVVVGMSANRQAVAIGILMWVFANWEQTGLIKRVAFIVLASLFHASALFCLIFVARDIDLKPHFRVLAYVLIAAAIVYGLIASDRLDYYNQAYGQGQTEITQSSGAAIHVLLNAAPGLLILLGGRVRDVLFPNSLLRISAWLAIALIPLTYVASAAAGRISLYLFPVSIYVFSALPSLFEPRSRMLIRLLIVTLLLAELFGWLAFGNSAIAHLPYSNYLFIEDWQVAR